MLITNESTDVQKLPDIVIAGNGNIAAQLAVACHEKGLQVSAVIGRNKEKISALAQKVNAKPVLFTDDYLVQNCILIVALADNCVEEMIKKLRFGENVFVAHTSGTLASALFKPFNSHYGVFYPFQTYTGKLLKNAFKDIPLIIEANRKAEEDMLKAIALKLEAKPVLLNEKERLSLHLSGVMANNFTNYLVAQSVELLNEAKIDPDLLFPLLQKTFQNLDLKDPLSRQTGPARRGDTNVMQKHLEALKSKPELHKVYQLLSGQIEEKFK